MPAPSTISTAGLAPGVHFQWITRPTPPGVPRTDIAGFVGIAERGELHLPARIESLAQFTSTFGLALPGTYLADAVSAFFANGGTTCWVVRVADRDQAKSAKLTLAYPDGKPAVQLRATSPGTWAHRLTFGIVDLGGGRFTLSLALADEGLFEQWRAVSFTRGDSRSVDAVLEGSTLVDAWILDDRIPTMTGGTSDAARIDLLDGQDNAQVHLELIDPQEWEDRVNVTVRPTTTGFDLYLVPASGKGAERWRGLSLNAAANTYVVKQLASSKLIRATPARAQYFATFGQAPPTAAGLFSGGADGLTTLTPAHLSGAGKGAPTDQRWGLATLALVDEISILAMPDAFRTGSPPIVPPTPPTSCTDLTPTPVQPFPAPREDAPGFTRDQELDLSNAMIGHCAQLQDRVAVLDTPSPDLNPDDAIRWRANFSSSYGALYYPWLLVPSAGEIKEVPPSGAIAGVLARVSRRDSAAKPPANETVEQVATVRITVDDLTHGRLNEYSVNTIRVVAGRGIRVLGARTCLAESGLAAAFAVGQPATPPAVSSLGFLNVRRLVAMVETVVIQRLQEVVFDDNGPDTWSRVERSVRIVLDDLWRAGGLDGANSSDAYLVRCDATTNPPVYVDQGQLTCIVGIRPPWPAEFVIVRVSASAAGAEIHEGIG